MTTENITNINTTATETDTAEKIDAAVINGAATETDTDEKIDATVTDMLEEADAVSALNIKVCARSLITNACNIGIGIAAGIATARYSENKKLGIGTGIATYMALQTGTNAIIARSYKKELKKVAPATYEAGFGK